MKTKKPLILIGILLAIAFCFLSLSATSQITLSGKVVCGQPVTGLIYFETGAVAAIDIRGKRNKYRVTIDGANENYLLTFNSGGATKAIYVHTQQPDGMLIKQFFDLDIHFTQDMPETSVFYYSPTYNEYIWRKHISPEDRARLKELKLYPQFTLMPIHHKN